MTSTTSSEPQQSGFTHREILVIMSGLMLGMLMAALDQTIVSTSIRTISDDLSGYSLQAWVTTAYLITSTLATPVYGKLSDMYGRKPFYMVSITVFVAGSLLCSFATSMYELAVFRAIQGIGAGGLLSLAFTIMGDIVSPRERARYQGYFLAVFGSSSVIGPVLGGLFAGQAEILGISGWRWVFLVNVPVGVVAIAVVTKVLKLPNRHQTGVRIDWFGVLALIVGMVPLLIVAEQGREWGWSSPKALACFIVGALGVAAFIAIEAKMGEAALIPLRIFKVSTFALGSVIAFVVGIAMFGGMVLLPQYLQVVRGASPTVAGLQMLPMVLGMMTGSISSGRMISRTGRYRIFPIVGSALIVVAMFLLHLVNTDTQMWQVMIYMLITGLGLGCIMQPMMVALQNSLPPKDMGVSTAAGTFFRQIGGTLGVAVFLSILFTQLTPNISHEMHQAAQNPAYVHALATSTNPADQALAQSLAPKAGQAPGEASAQAGSVLNDSSIIQKLSPTVARPFKVGFSESLSTVFLSAMGMAALAFLLVLFWKEVPLRAAGALEAQGKSERDSSEEDSEADAAAAAVHLA